jgi:hypothetical protein
VDSCTCVLIRIIRCVNRERLARKRMYFCFAFVKTSEEEEEEDQLSLLVSGRARNKRCCLVGRRRTSSTAKGRSTSSIHREGSECVCVLTPKPVKTSRATVIRTTGAVDDRCENSRFRRKGQLFLVLRHLSSLRLNGSGESGREP